MNTSEEIQKLCDDAANAEFDARENYRAAKQAVVLACAKHYEAKLQTLKSAEALKKFNLRPEKRMK